MNQIEEIPIYDGNGNIVVIARPKGLTVRLECGALDLIPWHQIAGLAWAMGHAGFEQFRPVPAKTMGPSEIADLIDKEMNGESPV